MAAHLNLKPGDKVLLGRSGISDPGDWWHGSVLWVGDTDILVHQGGMADLNPHNALHDLDMVRAVGDTAFLLEFKKRASEAVRETRQAIAEAEQALVAARAAMWVKITEIGADRPGLEPAEQRAKRRRRDAYRRMGSQAPASLTEGAQP